ncbi:MULTISPECIES: pyridoxamine 5'-phosphate oxidase [Oceanibaculum]|uniref:Pyridoxine/pyridoxamine 5'-phosphate oxidase n=2 Tax=Oceanibaculum indicum TaxID=526216 RepID=K2K7G9_9PROT|nr:MULTISPECIES: pyridoxamine 5'-phosphate oxidase [Oceanibaculum]EKE78789.1 pyridoxamine 5'-phosphate oxidase [Oceanibaculum indicum P24]MCH2395547.1 pyridoxamine 5'-phosphate oxidase [Oceanibaculum sp.]RKQ72530.1 pyridoxamine 5'-phosphate oxidase [Oceanibaculum indicum]
MSDTQHDDPFDLFARWFEEAKEKEINDPNAMAVASVDAKGRPSIRMVLLKGFDASGFVFYTNYESRKGTEILGNPQTALLFHWKSLRRQVRIEGPVEKVSDAEADEYFHSRPRQSQIGAWASQQSRPLESRFALEKAVAKYAAKYPVGTIPRPPYWSGFRIRPDYFEFWEDRPFRLHDRLIYKPAGNGWATEKLYP